MRAAFLSLAAKVCKAAPASLPHPANRCLSSSSSSSAAKAKSKTKTKELPPPPPPPPAAAAAAVAKEEKKTKRKGNNDAASKVVYKISSSLSSVVQVSETTRPDALKRVWDYIKARNLQNKFDRKEIVCDEKLKSVFGRDKVSITEVLKFMSPHISRKD